MKPDRDPLNGAFGAICKFAGAGLFGCFVSIALLYLMVVVDWEGFWSPPCIHALWLVPIVWGILGIFRFNEMLDAGKAVLEWPFGLR